MSRKALSDTCSGQAGSKEGCPGGKTRGRENDSGSKARGRKNGPSSKARSAQTGSESSIGESRDRDSGKNSPG